MDKSLVPDPSAAKQALERKWPMSSPLLLASDRAVGSMSCAEQGLPKMLPCPWVSMLFCSERWPPWVGGEFKPKMSSLQSVSGNLCPSPGQYIVALTEYRCLPLKAQPG